VTGCVHFIHLGGVLQWQHWRAIKTAKVHGGPILLHTVEDVEPQVPGVGIRFLHPHPWLLEHPIQLANVKDFYAWSILLENGGMYLDLDTISLRPAWDLLGDADICVSREFPEGQEAGEPYNSAAVIAKRQTGVLSWLLGRSAELLFQGEDTWGALGPHLLTKAERALPDAFSIAPYRALNGWSYHSIGDYYANPRDPGEDVRVIHLYSSDHLGEFYADFWMP
jgi:hypothetical protein